MPFHHFDNGPDIGRNTGRLFARLLWRAVFGHGAVETGRVRRGVRVHEVYAAINDLVGANGSPVYQVGGIFDVEPRTVRAGGVEDEYIARHEAGRRARRLAVENDGGGACREANQVVGARHQLEDDGAVQVGRPVIQRHHGDGRLPLAGRDLHLARQCDEVNAVCRRAADEVVHGEVVVGRAGAEHGEGGVLGTAIRDGTKRRGAGGDDPVAPSGRAIGQAEARPAIGAFDGHRIGGDNADERRAIRGRRAARAGC